MTTVYDFDVEKTDGTPFSLENYAGQVLLIVNTATECGFRNQFSGLEALHNQFSDQGFQVLGFPCNQFGNQEPVSDDEMEKVCSANFGVSFPLFAKVKVNGSDAHPLYQFLKTEKKGMLTKELKWNFTKFLVNQKGEVVNRYAPTVEPSAIEKDINHLLNS